MIHEATFPTQNQRADVFAKLSWALPVALVIAYVGLNYVVHILLRREGMGSLVWPGSGVALAMLLFGGARYFWLLLLGEVGFRMLTKNPWSVWEWIAALANLFEAVVGYRLLMTQARAGEDFFSSAGKFFKFLLFGGGIACLLGSLLGAGLMFWGDMLSSGKALTYVLDRWRGHVFGVAVVAPVLLIWLADSSIKRWRQHRIEALLLLGLTFFMGQAVFLDWFDQVIGPVARGYWMFFPVVWVSVRLGRRGATLAVFMVAVQGLAGAFMEKGFFDDDLAKTGLQNYWYYTVILAGVGIAVAAYVNNLQRIADELRVKDSALSTTASSIVITDGVGRIEWANPAFYALTGYRPEEAVGRNPRDLVKSGQQDMAFYRQMWGTIKVDKQVWRGEIINRRKDGTLYEEEMTITPILSEEGEVQRFVAVKQDVTQRKALEREVQELAFHDALTHLPNRRLLGDRLDQTIAGCRRNSGRAGLMVLDMDKFKQLNDTRGHALGDEMLVEVAARLKKCVRAVDTVARMGGDEFVVLLENLDADVLKARDQAAVVAEKIRASLAQPYVLQTATGSGSITHDSTASIGVVVFGGPSITAEDALKWADAAMYQAKEAGRNAVRFFVPAEGDVRKQAG